MGIAKNYLLLFCIHLLQNQAFILNENAYYNESKRICHHGSWVANSWWRDVGKYWSVAHFAQNGPLSEVYAIKRRHKIDAAI